MRFKDKVALITAVGSGIGRATADIMAREGAVIIGVDNDDDKLRRKPKALGVLNAPHTAIDADLDRNGFYGRDLHVRYSGRNRFQFS